jgi:MipA family protein
MAQISSFIVLASFLPLCSLNAQAQDSYASIGAMGINTTSTYKDTDRDNQLVPFIAYSGKHFFLRGTEIGYNFLPKGSFSNIGIGLAYKFSEFDPADSNDQNIQLLDNRGDSILATLNARIGPVTAKLAQDVSDTHDGYYAEIGAGYPIHVQALTITPSINYRYIDKKMSDHQFGVSAEESARTGNMISAYDSPATQVTSFSVSAMYPMTSSFMVNMNVSYMLYNDTILKSPVVAKDNKTVITAGVIYRF